MIKKYKLFTESLLDNMVGPTDEEIINSFNNDYMKLLKYSIKNEYIKGIDIAIKNGINIYSLDGYDTYYIYKYHIILGKPRDEALEYVDIKKLTDSCVQKNELSLLIYLIDEKDTIPNPMEVVMMWRFTPKKFYSFITQFKKNTNRITNDC